MNNLNQMMGQIQKMQAKVLERQKELEKLIIEGQSGGGMVKVSVTGKKECKSLTIDPKIVDSEDVEMLEDLIVAAVNDALSKAEAKVSEEMASLLPPGMGMPFSGKEG